MITVHQLVGALLRSGWAYDYKMLVLAARFYKDLETVETLLQASLTKSQVNYIVYNR